MAFAPTSEQVAIIDAYLDNYDVIVTAGAGTGKSTTMRLLAESDPSREILYLAFNKSVAKEAQARMPRNVRASTAHSLAWGWAKNSADVGPLMNKMNDRRWIKDSDLIKLMFPGGAEFVEVPGVVPGSPKIIGPGQQARIALAAMRQFCQSGDEEISIKHLRRPDTLLKPAWDDLKEQVGDLLVTGARRAWADVTSVRGEVIQFTHDIYLKLYSLSSPDLSRKYDVVILDEAQDANPVISSIIMNQLDYCQVVLVGDESQSIYGFIGSVNSMAKFRQLTQQRDIDDRANGKERRERVKLLTLSESFRFGDEIACAANRVLTILEAPLRITGKGKTGQVLDGPGLELGPKSLRGIDAVLVRTNAGGIEVALRAIGEGLRPKLAADVSDIISFTKAAEKLQQGKRTTHTDLQYFNNWAEFVKVVEDDEHARSEFGVRVKLVDKYGTAKLLSLLEQLQNASEGNYDLLITTSHKSKGAEFGTVMIGTDFESTPSPDEQMLAYVAITRAKTTLYSGPLWPLTRWGLLPDAGDTEGSLKLNDAACAAFGYLNDEQANALVGDILRYLDAQLEKVQAPDFSIEQQQNYAREIIERMARGFRTRYPDRVPQEDMAVRMAAPPLIPAAVDYRALMDFTDIPGVAYPLSEGQDGEPVLTQVTAAEAAAWMVAQATSASGERLAEVEDILTEPGARMVIYRLAQKKAAEEGVLAIAQFDKLKEILDASLSS